MSLPWSKGGGSSLNFSAGPMTSSGKPSLLDRFRFKSDIRSFNGEQKILTLVSSGFCHEHFRCITVVKTSWDGINWKSKRVFCTFSFKEGTCFGHILQHDLLPGAEQYKRSRESAFDHCPIFDSHGCSVVERNFGKSPKTIPDRKTYSPGAANDRTRVRNLQGHRSHWLRFNNFCTFLIEKLINPTSNNTLPSPT